MKAVILNAGQGRRLLPLTEKTPKCALRVLGQPLIEWQLQELFACGIDKVSVVVGFGAHEVEQLLASRFDPRQVRTVYNPFYMLADNLVSCWVARHEMDEDFVLLNGDTMFEAAILQRLLDTPGGPIVMATDRKQAYDGDDMKVILDGDRLVNVGKDIPSEQADGESIGMILFRGEGSALYQQALEQSLRQPEALKYWYLSVIDGLAASGQVTVSSVEGLQWVEVDCPADLRQASNMISGWAAEQERAVNVGRA